MVALSAEIIDTLVGLVEDELLDMSSAGRDRCEAYRDLQNCRYALLIMATRSCRAKAAGVHGAKGRARHLRAIAGGKA